MSLLPINPADFPDVPTRKALIALDLQNDFLADDGALPVRQPDGMVDRILQLADALRATGYGEIIWVRSQFDTSRPAGEEHIMAADTPQLPVRPGASAAARARRSPPAAAAAAPLEADPDAFLSVVAEDQADKPRPKPKPQCVRKGTKGAEFLPAIAAAKGPRDYAMTKSYYSAFQSGQLLNLLRRQFATELYICGSMSNVSVYATALAASSHGFDITVVEDCCGYRSEMRHMNAARRLTEQTGCEFRNAADVIPTLKPKTPPPPGAARGHHQPPPRGPPQIPPELIAAAMAGSKGLPVRSKPAAPPSNPDRSSTEEGVEKGSSDARKAGPVPPPPPASPPDLPSALDGLKLSSADSPDNTDVPEPATTQQPAAEVTTAGLEPKEEPPQPEAGEEIQPVVTGRAEPGSAVAQEPVTESAAQSATKETSGPAAVSEPPPGKPGPEGQNGLPAEASPRSGAAVKEMVEAEHVPPDAKTSKSKATGVVVSEDLVVNPTPDFMLQQVRDGIFSKTKGSSPPPAQVPVEPDDLRLKYPEQQHSTQNNSAVEENPAAEKDHVAKKEPVAGGESESDTTTMAGGSKPKTIVSEPLCGGDTTLTENFLPASLIEGLFEKLCEEVQFKKMLHQGGEVPRFVAVQGAIEEDGTQPVYRHPSDESPPLEPFTPAVQKIREHTERALGHPVNHVLIQCYRDSNDYISEHSDKTLDIFRWSYIANVSIGAQRTMVFRTKRAEKKAEARPVSTTPDEPTLAGNEDVSSIRLDLPDKAAAAAKQAAVALPPKRQTIRCPMPHNSLIKMGLVTNEKWLHGIKADKRPQHEKSSAELAWNGIRISLTFRYIDTFISPPLPRTPASPTSPTSATSADEAYTADADDEPLIWGQGATSKTRAGARPVVNGQTPEAVALIRAFGRENNSPEFDWEANYGRGYDVLHMKAAPRYFGCGDALVDGRVRLMLAECGVKHARGDIGHRPPQTTVSLVRGAAVGEIVPVRFEMDDAERTTVVGDLAILLYLDAKYPRRRAGGDAELARTYGRLGAAMALEQRWKRSWEGAAYDRPFQKRRVVVKQFKPSLQEFEAYAVEAAGRGSAAAIAGGSEASVADCALWPVLHDIAEAWTSVADESAGGRTVFGFLGFPALDAYYAAFARRRSAVQVFGGGAVEATTPFKPDLPTEEFGLRPVERTRSPDPRGQQQQDGVGSESRKGVAADADADAGGKKESLTSEKGKLPMLTEFGGR